MSNPAGIGLVHLRASGTVAETVDRFQALLSSKGLEIFCRIDHSGEAAAAGLTMRPTFVLIFGSPKSGTPLMLEAPTLAIDLPMKALVWQDADDVTWLSYNSTEYLRQRHGIHSDAHGLAGAEAIFTQAAGPRT